MTTDDRQEQGKQIAQKPDQIKRIDENWYQVKSQSLSYDSWYDVIATEKGFVCICPDHKWRHVKCKHIFAVEFSQKIRSEIWKHVTIPQLSNQNCPFCKSENIVKRGLRHNKYGDIQKYQCQNCKKYFVFNLGFERMKASPQVITSAMQLYFSGESLRNVTTFLKLQGVKITHVTVYNWIKKYIGLMEKYLETITPQLSDVWRADEMFVKFKGDMKYVYALMDEDSRFWIAKQVSDSKYTEDVQPLLAKGKELAGKKPKVFVTDGAQNYHLAHLKEFRTMENPQTIHISSITLKGEHNNNRMERLNGEIRDREKVMRGLKKMDTPIIEGYKIYHNFVRPHHALDGKTPADIASITVEGKNKWRTLIENAKRNS
jgi:transposase-like protein/ribosomal protein L37AE/L43A